MNLKEKLVANNNTPKSEVQMKELYDILKDINYQPTVDESHDFNPSDDPEEKELPLEAQNKLKLLVSKMLLVYKHFKKNKINYIFGVIIFILTIFFGTYTFILGQHDSKISTLNEKIDDIKIDIKSLETADENTIEKLNQLKDEIIDKLHKQDIKILKNKYENKSNQ